MPHLLTKGTGSPKIAHGDLNKYEAAILHLLPHKEGGFKSSLCPWSSPGCRATCLNYAGRGKTNMVHNGRFWKSALYRQDKPLFMNAINTDLMNLQARAYKYCKKAVCRLDGTSDLGLAEKFAPQFPDILFYDYTKSSIRYSNWLIAGRHEQPNRYLTFSRSENNGYECEWVLGMGGTVAVVFSTRRSEKLPSTWWGYKVLDADTHDFRFLDKPGTVAGLRAKGRARQDKSGFVVQV